MKTELFDACDQIFFSGLSGLYQGILITLLVALGLRALRGTNAATRHAVWLVTLMLVASLIPTHCLRDYLASRAAAQLDPSASVVTPDPVPLGSSKLAKGTEPSYMPLEALEAATGKSEDAPSSTHSFPQNIIVEEAAAAPFALEPTPDEDRIPADSLPGSAQVEARTIRASEDAPRWQVSRLLEPVAWRISHSPRIPRATSLALLAGCLAVGMVRIGFLLRRLCEIRKLKAKAAAGAAAMNELFERLLRQLGIRRKVQLRVSALHRSPVLLGFLHPVVLIPADQSTEAEQLDPILRHELAHVRRRDDWANLVQQLLQALLYFHPAVWWISPQLSIEREIACDDHVLQQGSRARAYALLLADFANRMKSTRRLLAPGVSYNKSQLQKRIDMILNTKRNNSPRLAKTRLGVITSAAALAAALAIYAAPRLVLAQTAPAAPPSANHVPPANAPVVAVVATAPVAPAAVADNVPTIEPPEAPPTPPAIEPGPKNKSQNNFYPSGPVGVALPATPVPPVVVEASPRNHAYIVAVPRPAEPPHDRNAPDALDAKQSDSSIEERLRRLEKMVDSLVKNQERGNRSADVFLWKGQPGQPGWGDPDKLKLMQDMAQRQAARAENEAKRAKMEAETAMKLQQERAHGKLKDDQIKALEKQREALERQLEKLQSQIEQLQQQRDQLEEQHEKLKEEQQRRSELLEESGDSGDMALLEHPDLEEPEAPAPPRR